MLNTKRKQEVQTTVNALGCLNVVVDVAVLGLRGRGGEGGGEGGGGEGEGEGEREGEGGVGGGELLSKVQRSKFQRSKFVHIGQGQGSRENEVKSVSLK